MHRSARHGDRSFPPAPSRAPGDSQALSRSASPPGQRSSDKGITFDRLGVGRPAIERNAALSDRPLPLPAPPSARARPTRSSGAGNAGPLIAERH